MKKGKYPTQRTERVSKRQRLFRTAALEAVLGEQVALTAMDVELARGLLRLVPQAIRQAQQKKPDTRLLRLLVRYSGATNRRLAAAQRAARE